MNLRLSFIYGLIICASLLNAQGNNHRCYTDHLSINKAYFNKIGNLPQTELRNYDDLLIPVVVHIIYEEDAQNVPDDLIYTMVDLLSDDFSARNLDIEKVPAIFKASVGSPDIEFCLASIDPQGNPSTGINRYQTAFLPGIDQMSDGRYRIFYTGLGGADVWDPDLYLNLYITPLPNNILGFATFPESRDRGLQDGVCIDYKEVFFGQTTPNNRNKLGRTLTHEVGHWLGLTHIWGELEGSCVVNDGVDDTPPQNFPYYGCPVGEQKSCDHVNAHMNYMDYTNDQCMYYFSKGQIAVMRNTLDDFRPLIGHLNLCGPDAQFVGKEIKAYPNPFTDIINLAVIETAGKQVEVLVFETTGKLVLEKKILSTGLIRLSVAQLGEGFYVIHVREGNNTYRIKTLKIK